MLKKTNKKLSLRELLFCDLSSTEELGLLRKEEVLELYKIGLPENYSPRKPDPLFQYWYLILWGILQRVCRHKPVLFKALLDQLLSEDLLPLEGWQEELMQNEGITQKRLEQAMDYRGGSLSTLKGKRRKKAEHVGMALAYVYFVKLLKELKKIPTHADRVKHLKKKLLDFPQIYHIKKESMVHRLVDYFKDRPTLNRRRPEIKTLAYELTSIVYGLDEQNKSIKSYLSDAKKTNPTVAVILKMVDYSY